MGAGGERLSSVPVLPVSFASGFGSGRTYMGPEERGSGWKGWRDRGSERRWEVQMHTRDAVRSLISHICPANIPYPGARAAPLPTTCGRCR